MCACQDWLVGFTLLHVHAHVMTCMCMYMTCAHTVHVHVGTCIPEQALAAMASPTRFGIITVPDASIIDRRTIFVGHTCTVDGTRIICAYVAAVCGHAVAYPV